MNYQTPAQVDPIELRKKLRRMGIGAKFQFSQTAAMDAVTEAMGSGDPEIEIEGDVDIDAEFIADHVTTGAGSEERPTRLEAHELAYMVNAWSLLWDAPA